MDLAAGKGRLAELTIALSLATDLGTGQPMEHGLRTCWLSLAAAEALGLDAATRSCVYYVALLRFVGCTSDASETAVLAGGDDVAFNAGDGADADGTGRARACASSCAIWPRTCRCIAGSGGWSRALADPGMERRSLSGHCEVAARLAARLGLGRRVCAGAGPRL